MSEASMFHSVQREEIKSQCGECKAHNTKHYIWCPEANFGGR